MLRHIQPELGMHNIKVNIQHSTPLKHNNYMICGECGKLHPLTDNKDFKCSCGRNISPTSLMYNKKLQIITSENNTKDQQQKIHKIAVSKYQLGYTAANTDKHIQTISFSEDKNKIELQADYVTSLIINYKDPNNLTIDFHHTPRKASFNKRTKKLKLSKKELPTREKEFDSFYNAVAAYWKNNMTYAENIFEPAKPKDRIVDLLSAQTYSEYPVLLEIFKGKLGNLNMIESFFQDLKRSGKFSDQKELFNALKKPTYEKAIQDFTGHTKFIKYLSITNYKHDPVLMNGFILNALCYGLEETDEHIIRYKDVIKEIDQWPSSVLITLGKNRSFKSENKQAWNTIESIEGLSPLIQKAIYNELGCINNDEDNIDEKLENLILNYDYALYDLMPKFNKLEDKDKQDLVSALQSEHYILLEDVVNTIRQVIAKNYGGIKLDNNYYVEFKMDEEIKDRLYWYAFFPTLQLSYTPVYDSKIYDMGAPNDTFIYASNIHPVLFCKTQDVFIKPSHIYLPHNQVKHDTYYREAISDYLHIFTEQN